MAAEFVEVCLEAIDSARLVCLVAELSEHVAVRDHRGARVHFCQMGRSFQADQQGRRRVNGELSRIEIPDLPPGFLHSDIGLAGRGHSAPESVPQPSWLQRPAGRWRYGSRSARGI